MPFANLAAHTHHALQTLSEAVRDVPKPVVTSIQFNTNILDPDNEPKDLTASVDKWVQKGHRFIYLLAVDAAPDVLPAVRDRFSNAKNHEFGGRAYARLNEPRTKQLYVGSSSSLGRRFREHLGYGARGTYALHLAHWSRDLHLTLQLTAARYPPSVREQLIGALEDQLWEILRPMFGRQGRR